MDKDELMFNLILLFKKFIRSENDRSFGNFMIWVSNEYNGKNDEHGN